MTTFLGLVIVIAVYLGVTRGSRSMFGLDRNHRLKDDE